MKIHRPAVIRAGGTCARRQAAALVKSVWFPYDVFVAEVVTTGEARDALHQIAKRFDNGDGEPVYFGSHRRAQGVIVPADLWENLLERAEDELDLASAGQRLAHDDGRRLTRGD